MSSEHQKIKILLVEDDELMVYLVQRILHNEGYQVTTAQNGKVALELLEKESYDLLLTDILMPHASGFEVISKLKEMKESQNMPIIIMSSVGNEDAITEGFSIGADDFIKKPIMAGELNKRIERLLKKSGKLK